MADKLPSQTADPLEAVKLFNEFQSQSRARGEATLKLIMGVSGGMLTLSVGALLSGTPAPIPVELLSLLQIGIGLLFFSIAGSVLLMASMIVATFHMGVRWQRALESKVAFSFVATWGWLRVANALLFFLILFGFLGGIGLLAKVAVNIASGPTPPAAASPAEAQSLHIPHQSALPLPSDKRLTHRSSGPPPAAAELNRQHGIAR